MKKNKAFPLFLIVLLLFGGCSSAKSDNTTASSAQENTTEYITESVTAVTTAEANTTVFTTQPQTTAAQVTASSSQIQTTSSVTATIPVTSSAVQTESETKSNPFWSVFGSNKTTTAKTKESGSDTCFVTITCQTVKNHLSSLKKGKAAFIPKNGIILDRAEVGFKSGETAFDVINRACQENVCTDNCEYCRKGGIQLEYNFTPAFGTYYIEGIHQLYEKDCGSMSGWMFSVNGDFPTEGSSSYTVKPGDEIVFAYTCDMGGDIGNAY